MPNIRPDHLAPPAVLAWSRPFPVPEIARVAPERRHQFLEFQRHAEDWEEEFARRLVEEFNNRLVEVRDNIGGELVARFPGTFRPSPPLPTPLPDLTPPPSPVSTDRQDAADERDRHCPVFLYTEWQAQVPQQDRLRQQDPALIREYPISE
jgi:hypothetical protein